MFDKKGSVGNVKWEVRRTGEKTFIVVAGHHSEDVYLDEAPVSELSASDCIKLEDTLKRIIQYAMVDECVSM